MRGDEEEAAESKISSESAAEDGDGEKESRAKAKRDLKDEDDKSESGTTSVDDAEDSDEDSESKTKSKTASEEGDGDTGDGADASGGDAGDEGGGGDPEAEPVTDAEGPDGGGEPETESTEGEDAGGGSGTSEGGGDDGDDGSEPATTSKSAAKDSDDGSESEAESKGEVKEEDETSRDLMDKASGAAKCPACAPKKRSVPDVVIPFFERDLCKLKYTVKSILENDPNHNLGDVYLMWVSTKPHSDYKEDLTEVIQSIAGKGKRKVLLLDFSPQVLDSKFSGWFAQQVLKLKIASMVTSDHYLVMDAKNTIVREVTPGMFFTPCHQAKLFTQFHYDEIPKPHAQWYAASARKLNIKSPGSLQTYWPASITPMVFHRETVLDLLAYIGEDSRVDTICSGPLCTMFGVYSTKAQDQDHATEFTMYIVFAYAQKSLKCAYSIEQKSLGGSSQMALSLWRGVKGNRHATIANDLETVRNISKGILKPVMFGSQPSALDDMTPEDRREAIKYLTAIYKDAKLFDPSKDSADDLVDCVIGKY